VLLSPPFPRGLYRVANGGGTASPSPALAPYDDAVGSAAARLARSAAALISKSNAAPPGAADIASLGAAGSPGQGPNKRSRGAEKDERMRTVG
jgi:hypothetical protein